MSRVTRDDVARLAGTSPAVVSYVLNNGPRPVSAATRERVKHAIAELGYRPNLVARALRATRTNTIGLVVPDTRSGFFTELTHAVERAAFAAGSLVLLGNSGFSPDREQQYVESLVSMQVDGLLLIQAEVAPQATHSHSFPDPGVPIVYLNHRAPQGSPAPSVLLRNQRGARLVTEHLIEHGYRRIACLTGPARSGPVADRTRGWAAALRSAGRPTDDILRTDLDRQNARVSIRDRLTRTDPPDAVVATTDGLALDALYTAQEIGLSVPQDLAITGFGFTEATAHTWPPLTTVGHPFDNFGAVAMETLQQAQEGTIPSADRRLDVQLVRRPSCGCVSDTAENA